MSIDVLKSTVSRPGVGVGVLLAVYFLALVVQIAAQYGAA